MALLARRTAVLQIKYSGAKLDAPLALDVERRYEVTLTVDDNVIPSQRFSTPFGDDAWREVVDAIRYCATERVATPRNDTETEAHAARRRNRRRAEDVRAAGLLLYRTLGALSPALRAFLDALGPRRLVIESERAEIHQLPWETLTNESWETLATQGLSVVRCLRAFNPVALPSPGLVRVFRTSGPDLEDHTLDAVKSVTPTDEAGRKVGIDVTTDDPGGAEIVHLVAHGSKDDGSIDLGRLGIVTPGQLADLFKNRLMVLLWSCFSGMVQPWGRSAAMALQETGNLFVISFSAPLHFEASGKIAAEFYRDVFSAAGHQDPEAAIVAIRAERFKNEFEFCDWASLIVWLQRPVDLAALPLGRLRVPEAQWSDDPLEQLDEAVRDVFQKYAALGDVRVLRSSARLPTLPRALVRSWGGPAVHLQGRDGLSNQDVYRELGLDQEMERILALHPADRFRRLLDHLTTYRYALLIWTNLTGGEVLLVQTLSTVPANIGIVLISPYAIEERWPGRSIEGTNDLPPEPVPSDPAKLFVHLASQDRFDDALALPEVDGDVEYWSARYTACVKQKADDAAIRHCIDRLKTLSPIEADLVEANLLGRRQEHVKARELYLKAADAAQRASQWRELARVRQELAYVAGELGDRGLAEQMFANAIERLEQCTPALRDTRWSSALGRALRDHADLLATDGREEAFPLLERATAIHAFEGRVTQVAYCYVTRSRLLCRLGRYDAADKSAQEAAIVFERAGNQHGWVEAVRLVAAIAAERHRPLQALAVLRQAVVERQAASRRLKPALVAKLLAQMAEVAWASGHVEDAGAHGRRALALLKSYQVEWRDIRRLVDVIESLTGRERRVAALAGRMNIEENAADDLFDRVRIDLARAFADRRVEVLVSSAARGADLLALDVAGSLGIRRKVILPFAPDRFRSTSVGDGRFWTTLYDEVMKDVGSDVIILDEPADDPYAAASRRILEEARNLAHDGRPSAIVVWDGQRRDASDRTADFKDSAEQSSFEIVDIRI